MTHRLNGIRAELIEAIDNCIVGFKSTRNREIIKNHYVDGMTFEEVAELHDMSVRQVKKISYDNEPIIIDYLKRLHE